MKTKNGTLTILLHSKEDNPSDPKKASQLVHTVSLPTDFTDRREYIVKDSKTDKWHTPQARDKIMSFETIAKLTLYLCDVHVEINLWSDYLTIYGSVMLHAQCVK